MKFMAESPFCLDAVETVPRKTQLYREIGRISAGICDEFPAAADQPQPPFTTARFVSLTLCSNWAAAGVSATPAAEWPGDSGLAER